MLLSYYKGVKDSHLKEMSSPKKGAWVSIVTHDHNLLQEYAELLKLDADALYDGVDLHESPRIEHYGSTTYIYVRYCDPSGQLTSTEPLLIIKTVDYVISVSRKPVPVIEDLLKDPELITSHQVKVVLQMLNKINKGYRHYINNVTKQIFATRNRLERKIVSNDDILGFIDTEEDLNEFLAALMPYGIVLKALVSGKYFKLHEEDRDLIEDLELSTNELIDLSKSRLKTMQNIREAYTTIATNNLNKVFKRLTSITIFLMIPTLIAGFYGMNIKLPLADNDHAFWILAFASSFLVAMTATFFNKKNWL